MAKYTGTPKYAVGTKYISRGKAKKECAVMDFLVTRNLAGEIVKEEYLVAHNLLGQGILSHEIELTITMALAGA